MTNTNNKDLNEMFEEKFELDEALRLNPDLIGKTFKSHAEALKGKADEYSKIADAERHGKNYSIYKRYMGSNKTFHHIVVDNDEDKIISQSTSADAALKKANLHPVHIIKESLNEISKDTLISYDDKARKAASRLSKSISSSNDREYRQELMGNSKAAERIFYKKKDNQIKLDKRYDGLKRAHDVLYPNDTSVKNRARKNSKIDSRIKAYNKPIAEDLDFSYSDDNEIKHKLKTIMTYCDHMYHLFDLGENIPDDLEDKLDDILTDLAIYHDEVLDPIEDEIEDYYEDEDEIDEENYDDMYESTITDKDKVLVHSHKMGTDTGKYGTFNIEKVTPTQIHARDHNTEKLMKFNIKTNRGIGEHDHLYMKYVLKEDLNEVSKDTLKSYIKKAKTDKLYRKAYAETGVFDEPEDLKKLANRKFGLKKARSILSNKE